MFMTQRPPTTSAVMLSNEDKERDEVSPNYKIHIPNIIQGALLNEFCKPESIITDDWIQVYNLNIITSKRESIKVR